MGREGARCRTSPANKTQRHGALYTGESAIYKGDCAIHKGECAIYKGVCHSRRCSVLTQTCCCLPDGSEDWSALLRALCIWQNPVGEAPGRPRHGRGDVGNAAGFPTQGEIRDLQGPRAQSWYWRTHRRHNKRARA